jgi:predicted phage terminase large subunit-like protein
VGTILHLDSLLEGLLNDPVWYSKRYAAHNEDHSEILWPEKFPKERLEMIYKGYVHQGVPEKYYQEYLNVPIDPHNAYFKETDFLEMENQDFDKPKNYYAAVDFAISGNSRADRTVITVGGVDSDNTLNIEYVLIGRWDAKQFVDDMISVQRRFDIDIFTVESGMIEKSIGPYLNDEMMRTGVFLNLNKEVPTKDKETRARSIQARMRAGGVKFDTDASWYDELHDEMLVFPRGKHDDIVDSMAWLGLTLDKFATAPTIEEKADEEWEEEFGEMVELVGISATTGY